jgi:MFS transporter, DHA1 family, inner membrane transport protein
MTSTLPRSELKLLLLLAAVQFTLIMDFMVIMPLGPQLMRQLEISPQHFGGLISAFGITAGVIGLAFAPFADRFDRKRLLLCAYAGFVLATLACGLSPNSATLMVARALCGACGGICGATIMAIVSDVVPASRRARGMAILMTSFSVAAALGVPFGLKLAQRWSWEAPFLAVAAIAAAVWILLVRLLPPVRGHLEAGEVRSARDFLCLLRDANAWRGLALMMVVVFGHFTIIPYLSPFLVRNVGVAESDLFLVYLIGGLVTVVSGPIIGKLADRYGRFRLYAILVVGACAIIRVLTASGPRPEWQALIITGLFFMIASGRFIPSQATISMAVPSARRGAFMSLVACTRDLSAGITTAMGGVVVVEAADGTLLHYDRLGLLAIGVSLASLWVFRRVRSVEAG